MNFIDPFGLQADNPAKGVGGGIDVLHEYIDAVTDLREAGDARKAMDEYAENNLEPGEERDVDILVDPLTKEVLSVQEKGEGSITKRKVQRRPRKASRPKFEDAPPGGFPPLTPTDPGFDPNNSPLCTTCPCSNQPSFL